MFQNSLKTFINAVLVFIIFINYSNATLIAENPTAKIRPISGSGYVTLKNEGSYPIVLVKFSSEIADETQLHEVIRENDVMKMRQQENKVLQPNETLELKSMSWHFMFLNLDNEAVNLAQKKGVFNMIIEYKEKKDLNEKLSKRKKLIVPVKILTQ